MTNKVPPVNTLVAFTKPDNGSVLIGSIVYIGYRDEILMEVENRCNYGGHIEKDTITRYAIKDYKPILSNRYIWITSESITELTIENI